MIRSRISLIRNRLHLQSLHSRQFQIDRDRQTATMIICLNRHRPECQSARDANVIEGATERFVMPRPQISDTVRIGYDESFQSLWPKATRLGGVRQ